MLRTVQHTPTPLSVVYTVYWSSCSNLHMIRCFEAMSNAIFCAFLMYYAARCRPCRVQSKFSTNWTLRPVWCALRNNKQIATYDLHLLGSHFRKKCT